MNRGWPRFGFLVFLVALGFISCKSGYRSTAEVTLSGSDVVYLRDDRTGLCFAVLVMQNPTGTSIKEMSMTSVPCEKLGGVSTK